MGSIASGVIGLTFEGIFSFLHHKRHKALHKAVKVIEKRVDMQHNRVCHLEDTMIMYGKYNSDTLMNLIETVHKMHNTITWKEKIFMGTVDKWLKDQLTNSNNEFSYSIDSVLFLTTIKEKYVRMYERFIVELKILLQSDKNPFKRVFAYFFNTTIQIKSNFGTSKVSTYQNK